VTAVLTQPVLLLLAGLFGGGVFLVIAGQPLGRPGPDLFARVRELDPQHWPNRLESQTSETTTGWLGVPVIDALVQPLLEEAARHVGRALAYFGIADPREIERKLKLVAPRSSLKEYYGEHLLAPAALLAAMLATDRGLVELGIVRGGFWPIWSYVVIGMLAFVAPDIVLQDRLKRRRRRIVSELPQALDLLGIAVLAGQSLQQALVEVAPLLAGPVSAELVQVQRELRLGHTTVREALDELASRNQIPELTHVVEGLVTIHSANLPAAPALEQMAASLRHERLQQIVEAGGRALEKMTLPLIVCVLVPLFALIALPVGAALFGPR
jgi:tight adherence protein C